MKKVKKSKVFYYLILLTFIMITAFNVKRAYPISFQVFIHGQVLVHLDEGSGGPISDASVSVDFDGTILDDVTDENGYYVIEGSVDIEPGNYTITVSADNCATIEYVLNVEPTWDGEEEIDFEMYCVAPDPTGDIIGCVYDSLSESPLGDCEVTYWNDDSFPETIATLPNGCYQIRVPVGWWDITASKIGFEPKTFNDVSVGPMEIVTQNFYLTPQKNKGGLLPWIPLLLE